MDIRISTGDVALLVALIGGTLSIVLAFVNKRIPSKDAQITDSANLRRELNEQLEKLQDQLNDSKQKYYQLLEENLQLKVEVSRLKAQLEIVSESIKYGPSRTQQQLNADKISELRTEVAKLSRDMEHAAGN